VSSGLLGLGLGRLSELRVERIDQAARRRWLALLFGVSGLVLVVGLPLAVLLEVPLATALAGASGPLATLLVVVFVALGVPLILLLSVIVDWIGPLDFHISLPALNFGGGTGGGTAPDQLLTVVTWVVGLIVAFDIVVILIVVATILRRRRRRRRGTGPELREAEPMTIGLALGLPRLRRRRPWTGTPSDAVEAYRLSLGLLIGRDEGRRPGETPREHANRVRESEVGQGIARLAADYQLAALAGRRLTAPEERRAHARWARIRRWTR
jgi:hypothetical protein